VRASVADVEFELMLCIALVVAVIFVFLRTFAATIIPSVAVPLSLVGTFGAMYALGYSLNNLTLMALTISTGFVVDDAIVMIENISRYVEQGEKPLAAALKGAEQIGFTIMSLTVSLIAVLIPLLFMGDITGRLFREFAVTLSVDDPHLGAVSLTLTPMLCAKLLKHPPRPQQGRFYKVSSGCSSSTIAFYGRHARLGARAPRTLTSSSRSATLVLTICSLHRRPEGLLPRPGHGEIQGVSEATRASRSPRWRAAAAAGDVDPEGSGGREPLLVHRRRRHEHDAQQRPDPDQPQAAGAAHQSSASDVIRACSPRSRQVEGISLYMQPVQDISVEDIVSRTEYQYSLQDPTRTSSRVRAEVRRAAQSSCPSWRTWRATCRPRAARRS
jgi:multidrug efflux pump